MILCNGFLEYNRGGPFQGGSVSYWVFTAVIQSRMEIP